MKGALSHISLVKVLPRSCDVPQARDVGPSWVSQKACGPHTISGVRTADRAADHWGYTFPSDGKRQLSTSLSSYPAASYPASPSGVPHRVPQSNTLPPPPGDDVHPHGPLSTPFLPSCHQTATQLVYLRQQQTYWAARKSTPRPRPLQEVAPCRS